MEKNIFEELHDQKQQLRASIQKAKEFGWITAERQQEMLVKLDQDTLTIGVIGQMKCGKSTFLNAFVFEDNVLPAATTPMTAALSVITYGKEKKIEAEFYTADEWAEQKLQASRSWDEVEGNPLEESKVKAAKELVEKASYLGGNVQQYLGKKQEDTFENLEQYVGAEGRYISITKSVRIFYPKEYLKGVEIVDTPGFNDPIVSREERTKAFLKKADVVLLMLYAGRPFDATDRNILFKNVRQCGIGKVLIGINKYDIPYGNGETEDAIKEYVTTEIKKASKAYDDETLADILKEATPIPLSAEMALLSELPMTKIMGNEAFQFAWKRACDTFEISSQAEMREKSHITNLTDAVRNMVKNEKEKILFAKPVNALTAAGLHKKEETDKALRECEGEIQNLSIPDDELEEKEDNLNRAERKLQRKIDSLGEDIESGFKQLIRLGKNELEDEVDKACREMDEIVGRLGRFQNAETIYPQLDRVKIQLLTRTLKRKVEELGYKAKKIIKGSCNEFMDDAEDILLRYTTDFDSRAFIKGIEKRIELDIQDESMFKMDNSDNGSEYGWDEMIWDFINNASWGVFGKLSNALSHDSITKQIKDSINAISTEFDPVPYLNTIFERKEEIINLVKTAFIEELLKPMQEQIQEIRTHKGDKAKRLNDAKSRLVGLKEQKEKTEKQLKELTANN